MKTFRALSSRFTRPAPAALAVVVLFLSGCRTAYVVQVDAVSPANRAAREAQSFKIRAHNPQIDEDSLRYREVSAYVKTALSGRGMYEAPSVESADLIIEIDYGIETPRMKYETVTTSRVVAKEGVSPSGLLMDRRLPRVELLTHQEVLPVVVYEKFLKVSARENKEGVEGRRPAEVWSVNVSAEDKSNELRKYLPILASATADYIDTNTRQERSVSVREEDESVGFIKKGM